MLLTSQAVQGRILGLLGRIELSMKRLVVALAGLFALGWSGMVFAQAGPTTCPTTNFICAFSAAETMSLVTPKGSGSSGTAGQPDVYVGYLSFGASGAVTLTGSSDINGTVTTGINMPGTCTDSTAPLQPATLTFPGTGKTQTILTFVKNTAGTELQFILIQDVNSTSVTSANSVRIGVCRQ